MRIGKFVEHFKAAAQAYDAKGGDPIVKYLAVGRQLGYAMYLSLDAITVVNAVGIYKFKGAVQLQRQAFQAWLVGLMCNAIAGFYALYRLREREQKLNRNEGEGAVELKKLEKQRDATKVQLISDLCDLTVPSAGLKYVDFDDGIVGLAGTLSSLIGVWTTWKKTA